MGTGAAPIRPLIGVNDAARGAPPTSSRGASYRREAGEAHPPRLPDLAM